MGGQVYQPLLSPTRGDLFFAGPKMLRGAGGRGRPPYIIPLKLRVFGDGGVLIRPLYELGCPKREPGPLSLPIKFTLPMCSS